MNLKTFSCSPSIDFNMRSFTAILTFALAINHSLAVEWADSGVKISNAQVRKIKIFYGF